MTLSTLEKELENARKRLKQITRAGQMSEYLAVHTEVLSLERKLAAERMEEYAETIEFPVSWDPGALMPHLLTNGYRTFLLFYLPDEYSEADRTESVALVQFQRCISAKLGDPNEEVFHGHPWSGRGLEPYSVQIVRNSKWLKELEVINKVHSQYDPELWRPLNHYVFWFHDDTFECIAKSFEVEVFQKSMKEAFEDAAKRIFTCKSSA